MLKVHFTPSVCVRYVDVTEKHAVQLVFRDRDWEIAMDVSPSAARDLARSLAHQADRAEKARWGYVLPRQLEPTHRTVARCHGPFVSPLRVCGRRFPDLAEEMPAFPAGVHDDLVDALEGAFGKAQPGGAMRHRSSCTPAPPGAEDEETPPPGRLRRGRTNLPPPRPCGRVPSH